MQATELKKKRSWSPLTLVVPWILGMPAFACGRDGGCDLTLTCPEDSTDTPANRRDAGDARAPVDDGDDEPSGSEPVSITVVPPTPNGHRSDASSYDAGLEAGAVMEPSDAGLRNGEPEAGLRGDGSIAEVDEHCDECERCVSDDDCSMGICLATICRVCDPTTHSGCETAVGGALCKPSTSAQEYTCVECLLEGASRTGSAQCDDGAGVFEQVCIEGTWSNTETCVAADACVEDMTRIGSTPCGQTGGGTLYEICLDGAWSDTSDCSETTACEDNPTPIEGTTPCGANGRGHLLHYCENGEWVDITTCLDNDECADDSVPSAGSSPCGPNSRGVLERTCEQGQWVDLGTCLDTDVCLDGSEMLGQQECGRSGLSNLDCIAGQWVQGECVECQRELVFDDPNLEAVVRAAASTPSGPLRQADLNFGLLFAFQAAIVELGGIECLSSVTAVNLGNNAIADLEPLSKMSQVSNLRLSSNVVSNVEPLAAMTGLNFLYLENNDIQDLSPLSSLTQMVQLDVSRNPATNIAGLAPLIELTHLWLDDMAFTSLQAVSGMSKMDFFYARNNAALDAQDLFPLTTFADADVVDITGSPGIDCDSSEATIVRNAIAGTFLCDPSP